MLASCATRQGDPTDLDGPMFGGNGRTDFVIAPEADVVNARDLAKVARVLRKYKTLDAAEQALVKMAVSKRLKGIIALEIQRIEPKYRAQREAIRRLPDKADAARKMASLDAQIRAEALRSIAARLAEVAVPLKTSDNRSAVAFARVRGEEVLVAVEASEIDRPLASLEEQTRVERGAGKVASFLATPPVPVTEPN